MTWTTKRKHAELKNWINKSSVFNLGTERRKLQEQYQGQVDTLIHTWEGEIEKCKEMEEKLANTFRTQQKFYTGLRINQVSAIIMSLTCVVIKSANQKFWNL